MKRTTQALWQAATAERSFPEIVARFGLPGSYYLSYDSDQHSLNRQIARRPQIREGRIFRSKNETMRGIENQPFERAFSINQRGNDLPLLRGSLFDQRQVAVENPRPDHARSTHPNGKAGRPIGDAQGFWSQSHAAGIRFLHQDRRTGGNRGEKGDGESFLYLFVQEDPSRILLTGNRSHRLETLELIGDGSRAPETAAVLNFSNGGRPVVALQIGFDELEDAHPRSSLIHEHKTSVRA